MSVGEASRTLRSGAHRLEEARSKGDYSWLNGILMIFATIWSSAKIPRDALLLSYTRRKALGWMAML